MAPFEVLTALFLIREVTKRAVNAIPAKEPPRTLQLRHLDMKFIS
jgi:hypothetical protein